MLLLQLILYRIVYILDFLCGTSQFSCLNTFYYLSFSQNLLVLVLLMELLFKYTYFDTYFDTLMKFEDLPGKAVNRKYCNHTRGCVM